MAEDAGIIANVRRLSGVAAGNGPTDKQILAAVRGFVTAFEFWYIRVMQGAVPDYRNVLIKRINPFIRKMELDGLGAADAADRIVEDYNSRNFVTAGGWALEKMATKISIDAQKSTAAGIDIQRHDENTGDYHLYVLKSGLVTRNSDIINALKRNSREAEKRLRQQHDEGRIIANYAIAAGKTTSTFQDGIRRPSSAEFWGEMTGLPEEQAIELMLGVAAEAGRLVRRDASSHIAALKMLVGDYVSDRSDSTKVDWDFITKRNMRPVATWRDEDKERHKRALAVLAKTGYVLPPKAKKIPPLPSEGSED